MPIYSVQCADRATGKPFQQTIEATDETDAMRKAARSDRVVTEAERLDHPDKDHPNSIIAELRLLRTAQEATNARLDQALNSRIVRAPIGTVGIAILIAIIGILFIFWLITNSHSLTHTGH